MTLKLYVDLMSQPSRAIYLFLKATKIPFELCLVKLREGEHLGEEFGKLNPHCKVPVIDDNGFVLTESVAIMRYLSRKNSVADYWYPADIKEQAKVDEYLEWQHLNTRIYCAMYFQHKFLRPMKFQRPADEKTVAKFQEEMEKCLQSIEGVWLDNGKKPYITGDRVSCADILALCELEQPGMAGYDVFAKYPKIAEWRDRVLKDTEVGQHYEEAHKIVRLTTKRFKGVPVINKL